ncbi:MAG: peroxiredoxin-like family protein [Cyclobacteriaceae bacterium]
MKKAIAAIIFVSFLLSGNIIYGQVVPERPIDISPLLIGEQVPDLALTNIAGESIGLRSILRTSPSIVIFYRGGWCPYCNLYMAELQSIEQDILDMGYQILAVSPDSQENMKASLDKHKLNYQLFSDADMKVAQAFGIAYAVPESSRKRLTDSSGGQNPGQLPVPSVFVLNQQGEILFEYINPNYKKRMDSGLLLAVLRTLR